MEMEMNRGSTTPLTQATNTTADTIHANITNRAMLEYIRGSTYHNEYFTGCLFIFTFLSSLGYTLSLDAYAQNSQHNTDYNPDMQADELPSTGYYSVCCKVMQLISI
jgi:hypothetical protein